MKTEKTTVKRLRNGQFVIDAETRWELTDEHIDVVDAFSKEPYPNLYNGIRSTSGRLARRDAITDLQDMGALAFHLPDHTSKPLPYITEKGQKIFDKLIEVLQTA
jgi:hypothetical protein